MSDRFPLLRRDWKKGQWQFGIYLRTPEGSMFSMTSAPEQVDEYRTKIAKKIYEFALDMLKKL